jgi:hypothetical protein
MISIHFFPNETILSILKIIKVLAILQKTWPRVNPWKINPKDLRLSGIYAKVGSPCLGEVGWEAPP